MLSQLGLAQSTHSGVGARPYSDGSGTGFSFRVWAPNAGSVQVLGDFNQWQFGTHLMSEPNGYWSADIDGAIAGQKYKLYLNDSLWRKDPHSRRVTSSENSVLVDPGQYAWQDTAYIRPEKKDLVIYELHPGSFFDPTPQDTQVATFQNIEAKLDYLIDLGINCIELMPISRFPGDRSWGYNPIDLFAIENGYGSPDDFRRLVDACHQRGLAVYLDIIHNHYDASHPDCDLWEFDGWFGNNNYGGIYFYQTDGKCCTIWGRRPHYGRQGVVDFITDNVRMWFDEYHVDGYRWDSPINMKFYDGFNYNPDGHALLLNVNQLIETNYPGRLSMGEDENLDSGFDAEWFDSFHYNIVGQLTPANDADRDMWAVANYIATPSPANRVIYTETHDKVGKLNNEARLVSKIDAGDPTSDIARKRASLGALLTLTSPGIPLLFMGQEWHEFESFDDFDPLDWDRSDANLRSRLLFKHLIHVRRNLYSNSAGLKGSGHNVTHVNDAGKVVAFHRWDTHGPADDTVVVANFSSQTWTSYDIPFPYAGTWYVIFNSDASLYSTTYGNYGTNQVLVATDGGQGTVQLAPYSGLILSRTPMTPFDQDQDAILDTWETAHGLSPTNAADAALDPDNDLLSNLREFELDTDPHVFTALQIYDSMNIAGTENNWDLYAQPMKLTTHHQWEWVRHVPSFTPAQFKFAASHSWSTAWGDADQVGTAFPVQGIADPGGAETPIALNDTMTNVTLRYTFNETSLVYQVEVLAPLDGDADGMHDAWENYHGLSPTNGSDAALDLDLDGFTNLQEFDNGTDPEVTTPKNHDYNTMHLAGRFNDWSLDQSPMRLVDHYGWEIIQPIWSQPTTRLKFVGNQNWGSTWGDLDQYDTNLPISEFGDWQEQEIQINDLLSGVFRFTFNQKTVAYDIVQLPFVDHDGDGLHDDWETFYGYSTNSNATISRDDDNDGLNALEEYQAMTSPLQADAPLSDYQALAIAGSFNSWSPSSNLMTKTDHYHWETSLSVAAPGVIDFKFTANLGWDFNWGKSGLPTTLPLSGIATPSGGNMSANLLYPGTYHITFNERTLQFTVSFQPQSSYKTINLAGTFNGWDPSATHMTLVQNHLWSYEGFFSYATNVYFKFVADRDWNKNWGDSSQTTTGLPLSDMGAPFESNIQITNTLNGIYRFQLNETNGAYDVELISHADHDSDGIPDFWESIFGFNPEDDSDAHIHSDSDPMTNYEEYIADTDPTNSASRLQLTEVRLNGDSVVVEWQGGREATQYLMTASPSNPTTWTVIFTNTPPTSPGVAVTNSIPTSSQWFKLLVERP